MALSSISPITLEGQPQELSTFMHDEWPHHWTMEPNLEYIKKHGKQEWLATQEKQWSCKS